jgi:hypothetical protein
LVSRQKIVWRVGLIRIVGLHIVSIFPHLFWMVIPYFCILFQFTRILQKSWNQYWMYHENPLHSTFLDDECSHQVGWSFKNYLTFCFDLGYELPIFGHNFDLLTAANIPIHHLHGQSIGTQ